MATDAKAAALAEVRWGALADCDPAVYLNLGTGLSAALVVGGQVIVGRQRRGRARSATACAACPTWAWRSRPGSRWRTWSAAGRWPGRRRG